MEYQLEHKKDALGLFYTIFKPSFHLLKMNLALGQNDHDLHDMSLLNWLKWDNTVD